MRSGPERRFGHGLPAAARLYRRTYFMPSVSASSTWILATVLATAAPSCERCDLHRGSDSAANHPRGPPVAGLGPARASARAAARERTSHRARRPRVRAVRDSKKRDTPAWQSVRARCDEFSAARARPAIKASTGPMQCARLALCYHATGDESYANFGCGATSPRCSTTASTVGDGKGGATVVTHDSGYGIRTFAAYSALGYDWLRGTPG